MEAVGERVGPRLVGSGEDHVLALFIFELERCVDFAQGFLLVTPYDLVAMGRYDGGDCRSDGKVGADAILGGIAQFVGDVDPTKVNVA